MKANPSPAATEVKEFPRPAPSLNPDDGFCWHYCCGSYRAQLILGFWRGVLPTGRRTPPRVIKPPKQKRKKKK